MDGLDRDTRAKMSRREFMVVGGTSLLALDGSVQRQVSSQNSQQEYQFQGVADLLGPRQARPEPGDGFFEDKIAYAYRYEASDTGERFYITDDADTWTDISMPLDNYATPFQALKTASQNTQFALDASKGLTRRRYGWYSNNVLFDSAQFANNDANGTISIDTGALSANTARIRSAISGQYISQSLAQPGVGLSIADANVSLDANNRASLSHGTIGVGAGWHNGSSGGWNVGGTIETFIGLTMDSSGVNATLVANGSHLGDSPVPQSEWNLDPMDGTGPSGRVLRPQNGYIYNMPYTWYAFGALYVGIVHPKEDAPILFHKFALDGASFDRPNLPPLIVADDGGTAASLSAEVGGMQYALYGAQLSEEGGEERATEVTRTNYSVGTASVDSNNAVDPVAEPGTPVVSVRRVAGVRDLSVRLDGVLTQTDAPIWLFSWDEYEPETALTGASFRNPNESLTPSSETKVEIDTAATDYTPGIAVARGVDYVYTDKNQNSLQALVTDDRVPIDATRVITAVHDGTAATVDPAQVRIVEGY